MVSHQERVVMGITGASPSHNIMFSVANTVWPASCLPSGNNLNESSGLSSAIRRCVAALQRKTFLSDVIAGVTVGLVALPLAMAFAIASGVSPQAGLYCAIVAGFLISALGGSHDADRRPDRRIRRGRLRHRRAVRHRRPVHVHDDGRRDARAAGRHGTGHRW